MRRTAQNRGADRLSVGRIVPTPEGGISNCLLVRRCPLIWTCQQIAAMQHQRGILTILNAPPTVAAEQAILPPSGSYTALHSPASGTEVGVREPWVMAVIGFAICPTAFHVAIAVMTRSCSG